MRPEEVSRCTEGEEGSGREPEMFPEEVRAVKDGLSTVLKSMSPEEDERVTFSPVAL